MRQHSPIYNSRNLFRVPHTDGRVKQAKSTTVEIYLEFLTQVETINAGRSTTVEIYLEFLTSHAMTCPN